MSEYNTNTLAINTTDEALDVLKAAPMEHIELAVAERYNCLGVYREDDGWIGINRLASGLGWRCLHKDELIVLAYDVDWITRRNQ